MWFLNSVRVAVAVVLRTYEHQPTLRDVLCLIPVKSDFTWKQQQKKENKKQWRNFSFNSNFPYSVAESLLPGFTTLWPGKPTCSHPEESYWGPSERPWHWQGNFDFISVWDGGGIKRLSSSVTHHPSDSILARLRFLLSC